MLDTITWLPRGTSSRGVFVVAITLIVGDGGLIELA